MFSRIARRIPWKRPLFLALLLTAVSGSVALAATFTVIIGTSGNDTINKAGQPGNYHIYGLAGRDTLTGGLGDNLVVGDGHCPPGATTDEYCDVAPIPGDAGDTLRGGGGNNAIYGGGGPNTIYGGRGHNYIQAGPSRNLIYGGPIGDVINATAGSSTTIFPGDGPNVIDSRGPGIETIYCSGSQDTVYADANDIVLDCANVIMVHSKRELASTLRKRSNRKHTSRKHTSKRR
jgi:Ca2+-binding RTX toxin-like protein